MSTPSKLNVADLQWYEEAPGAPLPTIGPSLPMIASQSGLPLYWVAAGPLAVDVTSERRANLIAKRVLDILMAIAGLIVLLPLLLLVGLAIRLTSEGPALLRQKRTGLDGTTFEIFKFRSMYVETGDPTGVRQTVAMDSRVTPLGRFLRRNNIDELPQLLNVLRGEMSMVGPRPHVPQMLAAGVAYDQLVPYYAMRHKMKPGLTGWAQANGLRGPTDNALKARSRVNHDIAYIQNFSVLLDIKIILRTLWRELFKASGS
jgi:polysaccharide biosynthesis protein PslA